MPARSTTQTAIRVRLLFFASYRELLGVEELELVLPARSTVRSLIETVRSRPGGDALPEAVVVAVNQEYAKTDTLLTDGDEVAFIPPVAGG